MTINLSQELVDTIVAEIEKARRVGYRAGVEAMRDELCEVWPEDSRFSRSIRTVINQEADKLLKEAGE